MKAPFSAGDENHVADVGEVEIVIGLKIESERLDTSDPTGCM